MKGKLISSLIGASALSHAGLSSLTDNWMVVSTCDLMVSAAGLAFQLAFVALIAHTALWAIRRWKLDYGRPKLDLVLRILRILFALGAVIMAILFFMVPYLVCGPIECGSSGPILL